MVVATVNGTNIRNSPVISYPTDFGDLHANKSMEVIGETEDGKWVIVKGYVWKANTREVYG